MSLIHVKGLGTMTLLRFPEVDTPGSLGVAESLVAMDSFDVFHVQAESTSDLYKVGHAIIQAAIEAHFMDSRVQRAILTGVSAYEIFGSVVQGSDELRRYSWRDMMDMSSNDNGLIETLNSFDQAYESLKDTPELRDALRLLATQGLNDISRELVEHALRGAALLRQLQIELDSLRLVREEIDSMFN